MNFFGFGPSAEVDIVLDGQDARKTAEIKTEEGKKERHLLYYDGETVSGKVNIQLRKPGSRLDHYGIKVELIGQIELYYDRGNHHDFLSLVKELARPGDLFQHTTYNFEFVNVEKPYESYTGANVKLRYFLRVTIVRRLSDIVKEKEVIVHTLSQYPEMNTSIKMEVGIEDCLHIEFEYNKSKYHLKDVIVGKIYFLLVRIKIKHMEIAIIKRETTGSGPNTFNENETIAKYEIMDGAPVRGESIPIRVFLAGYELTPTMKDINKKFSVRYYLNLVLVDEEDRRYFKQQEIILWRKGDKTRKPFQTSLQQQYRQMQNPNAQMTSSDQSLTSATNDKGPLDLDDEDTKIDVETKVPAEIDTANVSSEPLHPEQPTPDKEFQTVINSAIGKTNLEKAKVDSPEEEPAATVAPSNNSDTTATSTKETQQEPETVVEIAPIEKPKVSEKPVKVSEKPEKVKVAEKPQKIKVAEKPQKVKVLEMPEKVAEMPEKVTETPEKVTETPEKVTEATENDTPTPESVSEKVEETIEKVEPSVPEAAKTNSEDRENASPTVSIVTESETGSP